MSHLDYRDRSDLDDVQLNNNRGHTLCGALTAEYPSWLAHRNGPVNRTSFPRHLKRGCCQSNYWQRPRPHNSGVVTRRHATEFCAQLKFILSTAGFFFSRPGHLVFKRQVFKDSSAGQEEAKRSFQFDSSIMRSRTKYLVDCRN